MPPTRPTYDLEQVRQVYDRIRLPEKYRHDTSDDSKTLARGPDGLELLSALQRYCLANVPFESLELHYSATKAISLDPDVLFDKIVTQGTGRGGYCMENNAFFGALLKTLGFDVTSTGGRVNTATSADGTVHNETRFGGWGHMLNIVKIQGERYLVDVGFGTGGPTHPLPLKDGEESINVAPNQRVRLRWDDIPENESSESKLWIFESQNAEGERWNPTYCFPDGLEFLPSDFAVMNYYTSNSRTSFFTYKAFCAKFVLDEAGEEIIGTIVLFDKNAHKRIRGEKTPLATFDTEDERTAALEKYLSVKLSLPQKAGIQGLSSAI